MVVADANPVVKVLVQVIAVAELHAPLTAVATVRSARMENDFICYGCSFGFDPLVFPLSVSNVMTIKFNDQLENSKLFFEP